MSSTTRLIIVTGLQGTGKTTVAKRIAEKFNASILRTDVIRKELFEKRQYTPEETRRVYDEMCERARKLLQGNTSIVLDAMFSKEQERIQARNVADGVGAQFQIVEVVCSEDVIKERIDARTGDASEATYEIYLKFKNLFEPVLDEHIILDNSGSLNDIDNQISVLLY